MIAETLISEIRARTDIVALVGEYVDLRQRGANFIGLCPFHSEKSPSFNVHRDRQFFHCFGCQESGDALAFLMRLEGLSFPEAARNLAERAGLEVMDSDPREDAEFKRERQRLEALCALMEVATEFYTTAMHEHPRAEWARKELEQRGVSAEVAAQFRLGYAPLAWDALATFLSERGHSLADATLLGLVAQRRGGDGYYDRFRHRLMFPIADLSGRVVAFSGRLLPEHEMPGRRSVGLGPQALAQDAQTAAAGAGADPPPKYVNSPESPLYTKGEVLFGLHAARVEIRRNGWAVLCEGNFDLVALHQAGVKNAVAPLGTAFTAAQAKLLRRFGQRVTLMFDGDSAGRKAVVAAHPLLRGADLTGRVARLPPGDDPDTFLRKHGTEALGRVLDSSVGIIEYLIDATAESAGPGAESRAAAIESLGPVVASSRNPVEIELYIERIARRFSLTDLRVVKEQLRRGVRGGSAGRSQEPSAKSAETKVAGVQDRVKLPELALQRDLLGALLDKPELFRSVHAQQLRELLTADDLRAIFSAATAQVEAGGALDATTLLSELADVQGSGAAAWLREQLSVETYSDQARAEETLRKGIRMLEKQRIERLRAEFVTRIGQARQHGDEATAIALTRERDALRFKW